MLLVSHSNQGLDNLLLQVAETVSSNSCIFRLGNNPDVIQPKALKFHRSVRFPQATKEEIDFNPEVDRRSSVEKESETIQELISQGKGVIIGITLNSLLTDLTIEQLRRQYNFMADVSFADEATRGHAFEFFFLFLITRLKVIMTGDSHQLGNIQFSPEVRHYLESKNWHEEEIKIFNDGVFTSFVSQNLLPSYLLKVNRRSLPRIVEVVNIFYDDQLICGRFDPESQGKIIVFDTKNAQDNQDDKKGTSWFNIREANLLVKQVIKFFRNGVTYSDIGAITPYQAQIRLIREKLRRPILFKLKLRLGVELPQRLDKRQEI